MDPRRSPTRSKPGTATAPPDTIPTSSAKSERWDRSSEPPFYAIPLYPGGPNTKGGLRANAQRQVLDWDDKPIPRLYAAGEISSVFQFVYQGGGNLAEGITFGRLAGRNAAAERPRAARRKPQQAAAV